MTVARGLGLSGILLSVSAMAFGQTTQPATQPASDSMRYALQALVDEAVTEMLLIPQIKNGAVDQSGPNEKAIRLLEYLIDDYKQTVGGRHDIEAIRYTVISGMASGEEFAVGLGKFQVKGLPAATYEMVIGHEISAARSATVIILIEKKDGTHQQRKKLQWAADHWSMQQSGGISSAPIAVQPVK